jgi:hypothetical protein
LKEFDLTGFVRFPHVERQDIKISTSSKTLIYLIAIDMEGNMSNVKISQNAIFLGDDITFQAPKIGGTDLDDIIKSFKSNDKSSQIIKSSKSTNLLSSVLIGWSNLNYTYKNDMSSWICSFRDLTNEGRRLYYSIRKLHNESEIRLLTFNKI